MREYTSWIFDTIYKQPITSIKTGYKYKIKIEPYTSGFMHGCTVILFKKYWIFDKEIYYELIKNNNGKMSFTPLFLPSIDTDIDYSMENISKEVVKKYEINIIKKYDKNKKTYEEFKKFKNWDGIIK